MVLIVASIGQGLCLLPLNLLKHQRMKDRPELVYRCYEHELQEYGRRLQIGDVRYVEGRGYGLPQYLIDHGARYCVKKGNCFCVFFGFILDDPIPELWFSPSGFDPMPPEIAEDCRTQQGQWETLSSQWGAYYRP
jgi:hypothetical protein